MQILYAIAIAAVIGVIVRYVFPHRTSYGIVVAPAGAAAAAAAVWGILAWFGWDWSVGGMWAASIGAGTIVPILIALLAPVARRRSDEAFFERARRAA